jgi:hypothetical protein
VLPEVKNCADWSKFLPLLDRPLMPLMRSGGEMAAFLKYKANVVKIWILNLNFEAIRFHFKEIKQKIIISRTCSTFYK